jgi:hypothetical protein
MLERQSVAERSYHLTFGSEQWRNDAPLATEAAVLGDEGYITAPAAAGYRLLQDLVGESRVMVRGVDQCRRAADHFCLRVAKRLLGDAIPTDNPVVGIRYRYRVRKLLQHKGVLGQGSSLVGRSRASHDFPVDLDRRSVRLDPQLAANVELESFEVIDSAALN